MTEIKFTEGERAAITHKIQLYFSEELKQQIGRFDAEFLLDFFAERWGPISTIGASTMRRPSLPASWMTWVRRSTSWNVLPTSESNQPPHDATALRRSTALLRVTTTCACPRTPPKTPSSRVLPLHRSMSPATQGCHCAIPVSSWPASLRSASAHSTRADALAIRSSGCSPSSARS